MWAFFGVLAVFALAAVAAVIYLQKAGTFPAPPDITQRPGALERARGEAIWLGADGNRVEAWLLPGASTRPAPVLMYAHGNGELIDFWPDEFEAIRAAGIHVLLVEYPGYGRSQGKPSEQSVTNAMVAAFDHLARDPRVNAQRIFAHGRSLGGGAMAQLAARRPLAALILESTFTSVTDIVRGYRVPEWLIIRQFDSRAVLAGYHGPVLILHGEHDPNIPVAHAHALKAALPAAALHLVDCGHNDCPRQWDVVLGFLASNGVCRKPDQEATHEESDLC